MKTSDLRARAGFASVLLIAIAAFACIVTGPTEPVTAKQFDARASQPQPQGDAT